MKKIFQNRLNQLSIIFWLPLTALLWYQLYTDSSFKQATFFIFGILLTTLSGAYFVSNHLLPKAMREKKMKKFLFFFLIFTILSAFICTIIIRTSFRLEEMGIFEKSRIFYADTFLLEFIGSIPTPILVGTALCGFRFYFEHDKLEKVHLENQLQVLKQQITPHFMFNVLNHIYILMQENVELASSLLLKYADILRYQLYKGDQKYIALEHDIRFLKDFIDIETIRWIDKIEVRTSWKIENPKTEVPPLLFITLIENAFKHVSRTNDEKGYINIDFEQKDNILMLAVENSKPSYQQKDKEDSGLGLKNMKKRLDLLFGDKYDFAIKETNKDYFAKLSFRVEK